MASKIRQNYHEESEAGVNKQINMELYASYVYLSMAYYFDRDDVAHEGLHKYFKEMSEEENEHAQQFMKFQNERGGKIILQDIKRPEKDGWGNPDEAVEAALELEKNINASLLALHKVALENSDFQMCDFIESHYLTEEVEAIMKFAEFITQLKRAGEGLGEYVFDKELQN